MVVHTSVSRILQNIVHYHFKFTLNLLSFDTAEVDVVIKETSFECQTKFVNPALKSNASKYNVLAAPGSPKTKMERKINYPSPSLLPYDFKSSHHPLFPKAAIFDFLEI